MKKTLTILVLSFVCFSVFGQTVIPDTIHNIQWELLDAPSGQATGFAKSGNRIFAAPHFYSDDMGENWQRINGIFGMDEVVASDDAIMFMLRRGRGIHYRSTGYQINIVSSTDGGASFKMVWSDIVPIERDCYLDFSRLYKKNDSTFFFTINNERCFDTRFNAVRLIFTNDAGLTWQEKSIKLDNFTVKDNVVYGHGSGSTYIFENDDFEPTRIDNSTGFFQYRHVNVDGDVYTLDRLNENIKVYREGVGFEQDIALPFDPDDETIGQFELVGNSIFIATNKKVYEMKLSQPYEIIPVFTASNPDEESLLIFGIFDDVWFVNDKEGIHRSFDDGITWEQKNQGFTNPDEFNFEMLGDRFWITDNLTNRNFAFLGYKDVRRSSPDLDSWETLRQPIFSDFKFLGYASGAIYAVRVSDNQVLRSFDDGESWEEVSVGIVHSLYEIFEDQNRIFLYNTSTSSFSNIEFYSDDGGSTWTGFKGGLGENAFFRDTFVSFADSIRYLSLDRGETWDIDTINISIPVRVNHNEIYQRGDTLFVFIDNQMAFSNDKGKVWAKTAEIPDNYPNRVFPNSPIPATIVGHVNGVVIANSDASMYVTKNFGCDWKVIKDVPFGDTIMGTWQFEDRFIEGSGEYAFKDGYLYCYKRGHGLWRTNFDDIANDLPRFNGFGEVTGRVYNDIDNNCIYDPGVDVPISNHLVQVERNILSTDSEGIYSTRAKAGNVDIITMLPPYHSNNCSGGDTISISLPADSTQKVDFPFYPQSGFDDVKISISASQPARPGFKNTFRLTVKNIGTESVPEIPITFSFNPDHYQLINAPNGDYQDGVVTFNSPISLGATLVFEIELEIFRTLPRGTVDIVSGEVIYTKDIDQSNNIVKLERIVVGSYDPNDKTVMPRGDVLPFTENELEYLIRFQNTGTDTAFNIRVEDVIASQFNLLTLEMIDASHDYELRIEENRKVVWEFNDILLLDSFTNEPLSHGYIHFSIKTDSTVADMEKLRNEAAIYFDFNDPIITNETEIEVQQKSSDLELSMTTKDPEPENWSNFSVEVTIENTGTLPNDNIIVHVPEPDEVVYQGRNEYQTTKGHFEFWQIQEWEVGSLEPGESATLTLNYFRKSEKPFNCFAQVIEASEPDLDSEPNNGSCCNISEDDEAVLEIGEAPPSIWGRSASSPNSQFDVIAYPNPFSNELNFRIQSKEEGNGKIQIFDLLGRTLNTSIIELELGENIKTIDAQNLPQGILMAKISNSKNEFQRVQLMKN